MNTTKVLRAADAERIAADWGELTWYASRALGNSDDMTTGRCLIRPACSNPVHSHPNCSEVLTVLQGRIRHRIENGESVELAAGDTITIPPHLPHNATNIGDDDAILAIAFSSADRKTEGA